MSDNLDFMAIFGGEGSLDLGSGGEDFDALFAEKEPAPQSPKKRRRMPMSPKKRARSPAPTGRCPGKEACGSQGGSQTVCCARKSL